MIIKIKKAWKKNIIIKLAGDSIRFILFLVFKNAKDMSIFIQFLQFSQNVLRDDVKMCKCPL